jgi:diaminopimelate epimerase
MASMGLKTFYKYQGTGNDFIIIDDRKEKFDDQNAALLKRLCDRKYGIGADGLILLRPSVSADFSMVYFNADGNESTMCGNGGRCIALFANKLGIAGLKTTFNAIDGLHKAKITDSSVALQMKDVPEIELNEEYCVVDTGSPHYLSMQQDIGKMELIKEARKIRYNDRFKEEGVNVNFVEHKENGLFVRTYERGVENETLSCGTGMVAAALYAYSLGIMSKNNCYTVHTNGGKVEVSFIEKESSFVNIWLNGPAECVFKGEINE